MGRHCGFSFYRLVYGKLEDAAVVTNPWLEDDYNYSHYMIIKLCIEKVEKVIVEHSDVIAVAWAND